MNRDIFYRKLARALQQSGFHLQAGGASQDGVSSDRGELASAIRSAANLTVAIHPAFDREAVQRHLDKVRQWTALACVKYVLGQPTMAAIVDADRFDDAEIIKLAKRFDKIVLEMLDVTAKLDVGAGGVRLSSMGILMPVFFDAEKAASFITDTQKKCKIWHLWKKTWVLPWVVNVSNKTVSSHRGLPFLMSAVLNRDDLEKQLFHSA